MKPFLKWLGIIIAILVGGFVIIMIITAVIGMNAAKESMKTLPQRQQQVMQGVDGQRQKDVTSIVNAAKQNLIDNKGKLDCSQVGSKNKEYQTLPVNKALMIGRTATEGFNLEPCIVPYYISKMPMDPAGGTTDMTGYLIQYEPVTKTVSVYSVQSYSGDSIKASATIGQ